LTGILIAVEAAFMVGMLALCLWGAGSIPKNAKIPLHLGFRGYGQYVSKTVGLIVWGILAVTFFAIGVLVPTRGEESIVILAALPVLLVVQLFAFLRAARTR
jgi:hypothetical protein